MVSRDSHLPCPNMLKCGWLPTEKKPFLTRWAWVSQENMEKMAQGIEGIYHTQYYGDIFLGNGNRLDELFATRYSYQHN